MSKKQIIEDEFTGIGAQEDSDFLSEAGDFSATSVMGLENEIAEFSSEDLAADEFIKSLDYDQFIILSKKEITEFIRLVEPWTKVSPDLYGKAIMIETVDNDSVILRYINHPTYMQKVVTNKSSKTMPTFYIQVDILKKIVTESYASVVFVWDNDEVNISLLDNLLFVQTVKLKEEEYKISVNPSEYKVIDGEMATILFKKVGNILNLTDRVSEKNIVFKSDTAYISTGVFAAKLGNPFEGQETFVIYKPIADVLATIVEQSKMPVEYSIDKDDNFFAKSDTAFFYTKISSDIETVFNPKVNEILNFNAEIQLINNSLSRIVSVVKAFDYLADVVSMSVEGEEFAVKIYNSDLTRSFDYKFPILGLDKPIKAESIKVTAAALKPYLDITGDTVRYDFNEHGLGISADYGTFLIRKKS